MKDLIKLIHLVKPLRLQMILAIILGVLGHLAAVLITVLGAYAILAIIFADIDLLTLGVILVLLGVFRALFRYGEQNLNHYIAFKMLALIRHEIFTKLRTLSPSKLDKKDKGDLISLITSDIELLEVFYAHTISPLLIALVFNSLIILFISSFNLVLGLITLLSYLLIGVLIPLYADHKCAKAGDEFRSKSGELSSFVLETLRGIKEFDRYAYAQKRIDELKTKSRKLRTIEKRLKDVTMKNASLSGAAIYLCDLIMLISGVYLYLNDALSFEALLISVITLMSSFGPSVALANLSTTIQNTIAAAKRVNLLLEEEPQIKDIEGQDPVGFGDIVFDKVDFSYDDEKIFEGLKLNLKKGKVIGIAGPSGIGKSTILKLIMRFYDPKKGTVKINERDLKKINTHELREMSSYMRQEADLFHDTIYNNLRIAKPDASLEEVKEACIKAHIHDLIMSLEKGYETKLSELGASLSSGERQRLNLARVFLHDSDLVLLDEPTSNLDSLSEGIILRSLKEEIKDKTIIIVSHRPSSLRIADEVIKMEKARVS